MKKMFLLILIVPNLLFAKLYGVQISDTNIDHFTTHECLSCDVEYVQHEHTHDHLQNDVSSHSHQHIHAKVLVSVADVFLDYYSDTFDFNDLSKKVIPTIVNHPSSDFIQELFRPPIV